MLIYAILVTFVLGATLGSVLTILFALHMEVKKAEEFDPLASVRPWLHEQSPFKSDILKYQD